MLKWKKDYRDLLAPHYEALRLIIENGPDPEKEQEVEFSNAIKLNSPNRPLQYAWLALQCLPLEARDKVVQSFAKGNRLAQINKSREIFKKLEETNPNSGHVIDYHEEMIEQGIEPPSTKITEPLGSRIEHLRERSRGKYNGR